MILLLFNLASKNYNVEISGDVSWNIHCVQLTCYQYLLNDFRGYFGDVVSDTLQKIYRDASSDHILTKIGCVVELWGFVWS